MSTCGTKTLTGHIVYVLIQFNTQSCLWLATMNNAAKTCCNQKLLTLTGAFESSCHTHEMKKDNTPLLWYSQYFHCILSAKILWLYRLYLMYCSALALHETWHFQLNKDKHTYKNGKLQSGLDVLVYIELHSQCGWFHKQTDIWLQSKVAALNQSKLCIWAY